MDVKCSKLANGARVITSHIPHVQSVAIGVWVGVGSRYETGNLSGVSHFIEHLLFKGTKTRSALDISREIEGRGGYFNAFTQEDSTCYYAKVACDHVWDVLNVLGDMYFNPRFDPVEVEKERGVIIEEMMMYRDHPEHLAQDVLTEMLWKGHSLGRPVLGVIETIGKVSRDQIRAFKEKKYVLENLVFAFAGNVEHRDCVQKVRELLKGKRAGREPCYRLFTKPVIREDVVFRRKEIEQAHLAIGFRLFGRFDKRRHALKLLNVVLGENMSSRLFQIIREEHGLAYSINSSFQLFAETGAFVISAGLEKSKYEKAVDITVREINKLKKELVGKDELAMAKEYITGQMRLALEGTSGQMMWMGENLLHYNKFVKPQEIIKNVESVTAEQIRETARVALTDSAVSLALVCPVNAEKNKSKIQGYLANL